MRHRAAAEAGQPVRGAERIGEPGLGSNAERREPLRHVIEQIFFAPEEVRDAGNVDPQSVAAIDMPVRTIAAGPARQLQKGNAVVVGLGGRDKRVGCAALASVSDVPASIPRRAQQPH